MNKQLIVGVRRRTGEHVAEIDKPLLLQQVEVREKSVGNASPMAIQMFEPALMRVGHYRAVATHVRRGGRHRENLP